MLDPTQILEYLGILINSQTMTFFIPKEKIEKLESPCEEILQHRTITVRKLASTVGNLMATSPAFKAAPLQVRFIQKCMNQQLKKSHQNYESLGSH